MHGWCVMANVSGSQGSNGSLYTPLPVEGGWKSAVKALLGGMLRKIRKADPHGLPSLKSEQSKGKQRLSNPPIELKSRAAMKTECRIFIQVLPQEGRSVSAFTPEPGLRRSGQQERSGNEVESNQRIKKQPPTVASRRGKSVPKQPLQPMVQVDELVQNRQQEQPGNKEKPIPAPRTRRKNRDDLNRSPDRGMTPQAKPRNIVKRPIAEHVKPERVNIYDVPNNLKKEPLYDVPRNLKKESQYDVPGNLKKEPQYDVPSHLKQKPEDSLRGNPENTAVYVVPKSLNVSTLPLSSSQSVTDRSDSIDPSTGEHVYESIDDKDFELEMLEIMLELENDSQNLDDAFSLHSLFNDVIRLEQEMNPLVKFFKRQRPPKSNPRERAAHMKQEQLLMKQQSDNKGFAKLRESIESLTAKGFSSIQEGDKVRSRVDKINKALAPALIAKYGADEAKKRLLKIPKS